MFLSEPKFTVCYVIGVNMNYYCLITRIGLVTNLATLNVLVFFNQTEIVLKLVFDIDTMI